MDDAERSTLHVVTSLRFPRYLAAGKLLPAAPSSSSAAPEVTVARWLRHCWTRARLLGVLLHQSQQGLRHPLVGGDALGLARRGQRSLESKVKVRFRKKFGSCVSRCC